MHSIESAIKSREGCVRGSAATNREWASYTYQREHHSGISLRLPIADTDRCMQEASETGLLASALDVVSELANVFVARISFEPTAAYAYMRPVNHLVWHDGVQHGPCAAVALLLGQDGRVLVEHISSARGRSSRFTLWRMDLNLVDHV